MKLLSCLQLTWGSRLKSTLPIRFFFRPTVIKFLFEILEVNFPTTVLAQSSFLVTVCRKSLTVTEHPADERMIPREITLQISFTCSPRADPCSYKADDSIFTLHLSNT